MAGQPPYTTYPTTNNHPSVDAYGSPGAPAIQTDEGMFYLSNDNAYPNALHVITAFPGDSNDSPDESMHIDNDSDIQLDNYGSPMAPAIEDLSQVTFMYMEDGSEMFHYDIKLSVADFTEEKMVSVVMNFPTLDQLANNVPEDQNIPQEPSSDQNNPKKYKKH